MRIHNIRRGFATNSSSTHSIIILPKGETLDDSETEDCDFGWGWFTAASQAAKLDYIFLTLAGNIGGIGQTIQWMLENSAPFWRSKFRDMLSSNVSELFNKYSKGTLDHQSMLTLPKELGRYCSNAFGGIDSDFAKAWTQFILDQRTVILGGNDNEGLDHPNMHRGACVDYGRILPVDRFHSCMRCRKNSINGKDWFTLFDSSTGNKVRISFPVIDGANTIKSLTNSEIVKAETPELVDIKITDYCTQGCAYCYQGSTRNGKHAYVPNIKKIATSLKELKVFEVAIGGGEPTQHPHFSKILDIFRERDIVPNFTSRSTQWLKSRQLPGIIKNMGAVAFSVNNGKGVTKFKKAAEAADIPYNKIHFQYVIGTGSDNDLKSIFKAANGFQVTLLGYKTTGRGSTFLPQAKPEQDWITIVKECGFYSLGIDTALAQQYEKQLKDMKIPENTYHLLEGKFSMYIDAVNLTMAPSSYCLPSEYVAIPEDKNSHSKQWAEGEVEKKYGYGFDYQYAGEKLICDVTEDIRKAFNMW